MSEILRIESKFFGGVAMEDHESFYQNLVARNAGLISPQQQNTIRKARILVAGCGSIGGSVIEPLVRIGAENIMIAEPDVYDFHNLNRQNASLGDIDINKGIALQRRMTQINPHAIIKVETRGVQIDNVDELVSGADIIFDGIDMTEQVPLLCKYALHQYAKKHRKPVITGYDIAGLQLLNVYDYRKAAMKIFNGKIKSGEMETMDPSDFVYKTVPLTIYPYEIIDVLWGNVGKAKVEAFPQLIYTAQLYGSMALATAIAILGNKPVKSVFYFDVNNEMRPLGAKISIFFARIIKFSQLLMHYKLAKRQRDA